MKGHTELTYNFEWNFMNLICLIYTHQKRIFRLFFTKLENNNF